MTFSILQSLKFNDGLFWKACCMAVLMGVRLACRSALVFEDLHVPVLIAGSDHQAILEARGDSCGWWYDLKEGRGRHNVNA